MKITDESREFVYSVSPNGTVEHIVLHGVELDWNDGDLNDITKRVCDKKPSKRMKFIQKNSKIIEESV